MGGGVLAGIEGSGNFAGRRTGIGDQRVGERGFAHAALPDQYRDLAGQPGQQRAGIRECADFDDWNAHGGKGCELGARSRKTGGEIGLVEHDDHAHVLMQCGNRGARDQFIGETGFGGDDQYHLRGIRGDQFLFPLVAAIEQTGAGCVSEDLCLAVVERTQRDMIAAGKGTFFPFRDAIDDLAAGEGDFVMPAKCGRDGSAVICRIQSANSASRRAAQSKSLFVRPPASCVL